jgi:hypothetical protein
VKAGIDVWKKSTPTLREPCQACKQESTATVVAEVVVALPTTVTLLCRDHAEMLQVQLGQVVKALPREPIRP